MYGNESKERLLTSSFEYKEQDPDYKGEPVEYQLQNGPVEKRPCRDVLFLLLFLALWGGMGYIAYLGFSNGDPSKLASPFDSSGHQCKLDKGDLDYANYPYVFAGELSGSIVYVCVKRCPNSMGAQLECKSNSVVPNCTSIISYPSTDFVNVCLPNANATEYIDKIQEALHVGGLTQGFSDLRNCWEIILASVGQALVISLIFSVFIRYCAACMVWFVIITLLAVLAVGGTFAYLLRNTAWIQDLVQFQSFPGSLKDEDLLLGVAITCWSLCGIFAILTCCLYKQIRVTIGIMRASADFVRQQCSTYFIPFFIIFLQIGFLALWITVVLFLFSSGDVTALENGTPFAWIVWNQQNRYFIIFYLFGLIWVLVFLSGLGKFLVSSIVACWYFQEGEPHHPFLKSLGRALKVFGSIAFGSLLITIVISIRIVLQVFQKYFKQSTMPGESKKVVMCCVKYASCVIACFERVLRFITDSAYVMMAITGKGFCASASQAFYLLLRQTSQQFVTHSTVRLFKWFGKILIATTTMFVGFLLITNINYFWERIYSPLFPMLAFFIVAYPVASTFMEFFATTAKTLLMCYCIQLDLAVNKAKCPPALRNFFEDYVQDSQYYEDS